MERSMTVVEEEILSTTAILRRTMARVSERSEEAAALHDVRGSGATVRCEDQDPLISNAQAQTVAVRTAALRGIDPDAPKRLSRAIVAPREAHLMGHLA